MPKPLKKRPRDPNLWGRQMVEDSTAEPAPDTIPTQAPSPPPDFKTALSAYMARLGAKGGRISGKRRKRNLSKAQRHAIALKGARARWKKQ